MLAARPAAGTALHAATSGFWCRRPFSFARQCAGFVWRLPAIAALILCHSPFYHTNHAIAAPKTRMAMAIRNGKGNPRDGDGTRVCAGAVLSLSLELRGGRTTAPQ
jgi:hypothetical protein